MKVKIRNTNQNKTDFLSTKISTKISTKKGFSLVELMIVVSIIGILASIGVPSYQNYANDAKNAKISAIMNTLILAYETCAALNDAFTLTGNKFTPNCEYGDKKLMQICA